MKTSEKNTKVISNGYGAFRVAVACGFALACVWAHAQDDASGMAGASVEAGTAWTGMVLAQNVVPEAERKAVLDQLTEGAATKTSGISAVKKLGRVALDGEFDTVDGRALRTRELVFEPGATIALHRHQGRPGVAYIIEGEITEYRVGADGRASTTIKKAGDVALEKTGVVHWWNNESGKTVRALVVDIVPAE